MNKGRKYENGETSNQRSVLARIHNRQLGYFALLCIHTFWDAESEKLKLPQKVLEKEAYSYFAPMCIHTLGDAGSEKLNRKKRLKMNSGTDFNTNNLNITIR